MTDQEKKDLEWASSFYLYDDLDGDWVNWEEEKLFNEIEKLAWQPFEHWEGEKLWIEIEKLADSMREYNPKEKPKEIPQEDWVKGYNKWKKIQ